MNKGGILHPKLFELYGYLWDRQVQLQTYTEVYDAANQPQRTYVLSTEVPPIIDGRRGVFTPSDRASVEARMANITVSTDTEYIALKGYYPQIQKNWRAAILGGQDWDITGVIFDSTRTQTYLIVERVTE